MPDRSDPNAMALSRKHVYTTSGLINRSRILDKSWCRPRQWWLWSFVLCVHDVRYSVCSWRARQRSALLSTFVCIAGVCARLALLSFCGHFCAAQSVQCLFAVSTRPRHRSHRPCRRWVFWATRPRSVPPVWLPLRWLHEGLRAGLRQIEQHHQRLWLPWSYCLYPA